MNIERGPRKDRGFTILDNALVQNSILSFGARGLAEYLLSLPPGTRVDIRSLAADNPEGRTAIAGYMNELEQQRYLVRTRTQGERGRFVTTTTIYEEPQHPATLPATLPKPWSKAQKGARTHLAAVEGTSDSPKFSQVGPNPASPDFGGPDFGGPGPGEPDVGDAGVNPLKELGGRTTSSPVREKDQPNQAEDPEGGGGGDAPQQQEEDTAALAFVDRLPYRGRVPGPRQKAHLVHRVGEALAAGWTEFALRVQLTEETDTAKSLAAVYRHRLAPENLPEPPPLPKPRTGDDGPSQSVSLPGRARCQCGNPFFPSADVDDDRCKECRSGSMPAPEARTNEDYVRAAAVARKGIIKAGGHRG